MKQAIAAFLLCLSLVLGGVALAAHTLQEDAGQVAVTAISRQGDPAAAQGLVATQSCQYAQTLLWDLTIPLDRPAQSTTAFSAQGDVPAAANDDAGVYLRFPHQDVTLSAEPGYSLDFRMKPPSRDASSRISKVTSFFRYLLQRYFFIP